jgi:uncharacterized protein
MILNAPELRNLLDQLYIKKLIQCKNSGVNSIDSPVYTMLDYTVYYRRDITENFLRLSTQYPVVTLTGPRQSGKTTLCRKVFPDKTWVSLENPDNRNFAINDPHGFLEKYSDGAIIDEIQHVPSLLSYIQTIVDERNEKGLYVLTGSNQFQLLESVTQSLAGRTALLKLLPFSGNEIYHNQEIDLYELLYKGFYPRIFSDKLDPSEFYAFYLETYIDRDVRKVLKIENVLVFENFVRLCAGRTGQVLNYASLADDVGVDAKTIKKWLTVLETGYILGRLLPYYKNLNKRLIKQPKIFFYDTGLVCYLLGIRSSEQLKNHPLYGAIFETYILGELWKKGFNSVISPPLFFFRDSRGREVDVVIENAQGIDQVEIKGGKTVSSHYFKGLKYLKEICPVNNSYLVYSGAESFIREGIHIVGHRECMIILDK